MTLNGGTVTTTGSDSHAVFVNGAGSLATLGGASVLNTAGAGSIGLYALGGGVINATGPITISTLGTNSTSTSLSAFGVNADGAGSQINLAAATITTAGQGAVGLYASDRHGDRQRRRYYGVGTIERNHRDSPQFLWRVGGKRRLHDCSQWPERLHDQRRRIRALRQLRAARFRPPIRWASSSMAAPAGGVEANGPGSTATLKGSTSIALNGSGDVGLLAATGGAISAQGPTSITVSGALSTGVQALSGSVTASGALNVTTSQASSSAFALSGSFAVDPRLRRGNHLRRRECDRFLRRDQRRRDL